LEAVAGAQARLTLALLRPEGVRITGLRHSLADIVDRSPHAMALLDESFRHLGASDAYCEQMRTDRTAILGKTHKELFLELPEGWETAQQRCLAGESAIFEDEWGPVNADEPLRLSWQFHPWSKSRSKIGGAILFLKEITATKGAEQEPADLLAILDNAPGLIALASPSGALTFMNRAGRELIGLDRIDKSAKLTFADIARPLNDPNFSGQLPDCNWRDERVIQNLKTGEAVPLLLELRKIHDDLGAPCGFAWIGTDLRNPNPGSLNLQALHLQSQQAQKLETVCRTAGRVAHDLNNMLLVIDAYAAMLTGELAIDTHIAAEVTSIRRAGERATRLVQELLALSQF
jgi:PAS domain-containing protein